MTVGGGIEIFSRRRFKQNQPPRTDVIDLENGIVAFLIDSLDQDWIYLNELIASKLVQTLAIKTGIGRWLY